MSTGETALGLEDPSAALRKKVTVYDSAHRPHPFLEELFEVWKYRDLVRQWTVRNITLRYKRSVLGILWTLLEPLILMVILTVVFSQLFRFRLANYSVYLLSGLLLFDFFSRSTQQMMEDIITSDNLAKRIYMPRSAFAVASILSYLTNWMIALVPLFAIAVVLGHPLEWTVLALPAGILCTALFALGIGLTVATVSAFFHDFRVAYQVLLTAWLYFTPIIYPVEIIPERWRWLFELNPVFHLVRLVRDPVYEGTLAPLESWLIGGLSGVGVATVGWWVFTRWRSAFEYRV